MSHSAPPTESHEGARPLSPHLQIYRPYLTMIVSILHRITGGALYIGSLLVVWWLMAAASGPEAFAIADSFFGSLLGRLILFGYTWALMQHMMGGLRHLIQDVGLGYGREARDGLARASVFGALALTALIWIVGYIVR